MSCDGLTTDDQSDFTDVNPPLARFKAWLLTKLDNDSVRPWVPAYNSAWLAWAILATFWPRSLPVVTTIYDAMGPDAYMLWVWMAIPANLSPIIGLAIRHGGSSIQGMSKPLLFADWMGLFLQAGGHAIAHVLLIMFEISVVIAVCTYPSPVGMTIFAGFMLLPWTGGVAFLCAQCLRKVQRGIALEHRSTS